jgi:RNA polymerase sigma factor (sigma-70 family)
LRKAGLTVFVTQSDAAVSINLRDRETVADRSWVDDLRRLAFRIILRGLNDQSLERNGTRFRVFGTTQWSMVLCAAQGETIPAQQALETLCRTYWCPIYVYVRRKGHGADEAEDLTQSFFAQLIAKEHLLLANPHKGRFRTFLLAMLDQFLAHEWSRAHRQKRGGQFTFISLDQCTPEERHFLEPVDEKTPEQNFQRQWALAVLKQTMTSLAKECEAARKGALFQAVKGSLSGEQEIGGYTDISRRLGMSEGSVRVAVHRLRQRYGELLRDEIAQTVQRAEDVNDELRYLFEVLSC